MNSQKGPEPISYGEPPRRIVRAALFLLILVWPFAYYFRCVIPGQWFSLAVGNDFNVLYHPYKVYLLDFLASGRFPLWSPSEAAGFPFYSSPFAQAFYPLNLPLALFYRLAGGYSVFDGQAFTVMGLALYGLGLYLWLGRLVDNGRALLFAILVMTVSFKLGDIMRFPNAVHAAAWMPWMLYGVTLATVKPGKGGLAVFLACVMLLTAGYPYYVYYCLFLVPPYVLLLLWPYSRSALLREAAPQSVLHRGFLPVVCCSALAGLLVCAPYLQKMSLLLDQTVDRGSASYEYATLHEFGLKDSLGSWLFPPVAQTEGWYYFGMIGVLLLVLWAASCLRNARERSSDARLIVIAAVWISVVTYITYGKDSYLFDLLWHHLPGFARLRAWARLNIILLPILALCLARAYQLLEATLSQADDKNRRPQIVSMLVVLVVSTTLVAAIQVVLLRGHAYNLYWQLHFKDVHGSEIFFLLATAEAFGFLAVVLSLAWWKALRSPGYLALLLIVCVAVSVNDLRPVGASQWLFPASRDLGERKRVNMAEVLSQSLVVPRVNLDDVTVALNPDFNVGYLENWYFQRYVAFHQRIFRPGHVGEVGDRSEFPWFKRLMGLDDGRRFFFSRTLSHRTIQEFIHDADQTQRDVNPELRVLEYDGDRLLVEVRSGQPLFFSFIDNWAPDWIAELDGRPTPIKRLFGTFKAVELPSGDTRVLMAYRPFRFGTSAPDINSPDDR